MNMKTKKHVVIMINDNRCRCICNNVIKFGYTNDKQPCVTHESPSCKFFDRYNNPIEYLAELNRINMVGN